MPPKYGAAPASSDEEEPPPPKPKPIAPAAASSSSGEDESSSGEEEEEEEEEPVVPPPNPKPIAPAAAPSSSGEGESSSGEEEKSVVPPPNPKPATAAKPASSSDEEESGSSDDEDDDAPPASKPANRTPAKPIPAPSATPSATKSKAFQRTWTDKDEIALLQGMLLYNASNGVVVSSNSDMELFHEFIRGSLQIQVRPSQIVDRVRRFKAKYQKTQDKGESPSFAKPHDAAIYDLSRKIWGAERVRPDNGKAKESRAAKRHKGNRISNGAEEKNGDTAVAQVRYPYLSDAVSRMGASIQSGFLLNEVIGLVDDSEAMALDKRHKKLVMMQVDLTNDTVALIKKATENMC